MPPSTVLRPATPDEAGLLTELARRSKAYWGYPADFLAACRADLTVEEAACDGASVRVAEGARARGWRTLELDADPHAEAIYRHLGAVRIGLSVSTAAPGRSLPRMSLAVTARHHEERRRGA